MKIEVVSPFPLESLPRVWMWIESFRSRVADDYGPQTLDAFVKQSIESVDSMTTWAVYRDGELGGMVSFQKWSPVLGTCHCLFKREMWGRKTTQPALEQIAREIFATGIGKISMCVFADNKAILSLLKSLGAVNEGHYRQHTMRGGKLVDMTAIALFREGFENANSSSSSRDRGSVIDPGRDLGGKAEDHDQHDHAAMVAGNAGPAIARVGVLGQPDVGSECRSGSD